MGIYEKRPIILVITGARRALYEERMNMCHEGIKSPRGLMFLWHFPS